MPTRGSFESYEDARGAWRWRRFVDGHLVQGATKGFPTEAEATVDSDAEPSRDTWEFQGSLALGWHWTRRARNTEVLAASKRTFATFEECEEDAREHGWRYVPRP